MGGVFDAPMASVQGQDVLCIGGVGGVACDAVGGFDAGLSGCFAVPCAADHELKPDHADAHNNLGNVLKERGKLQDAVIAYRRALALTPDHVDAYVNLGITLIALGRRVEALEAYRRALAIRPGLGIAQGMFVHMLQHACDWGEFETAAAKLDRAPGTLVDGDLDKGVICAERPFVSITRCDDAARNLAIAESWSTDVVRRVSSHEIEFAFDNQRLRKKRIRIGYLTADFHAHATAHLMAGLFGLHDRDRFTIHAYSYGPDDKSAYRARIAADSDAFADIRDLSTTQSARRIYQDEIDILVDLKGYSQESRLDICALRPARVQATYLGFPGTTGADFFDYVITDRIVTPEDQVPFYSENFVYLPHCYQVNDHTQAISNAPVTRADCGLPEDGFVFCSFNQSYKIEPLMWDVWMRILRGVPGSVLWLLRTNKLAEANLKREAVKRDVDPGRIVFADFLQKSEHLARFRLADLFLDTRIYNGHTTASDALWSGVPVVTLQGQHFASRVGASLLNAIGLPELICHGLDDYETLTVRLAREPGEVEAIRAKLARNRLSEPLFDTPRFTRDLESAFAAMWDIHIAGEPPRMIDIHA